MTKFTPIILWTLVLLLGGMTFYSFSRNQRTRQPAQGQPLNDAQGETAPGTVLVDVPWNHLPDVARFQLIDQQGNEFDSAQLDGSVYAVSFFFANCPTICRDLNAQVRRLNELLPGEPIQFVTISVDPDNDTPEILGRYAADFGAKVGRWNFLTGPLHRIKELGEQVFQVVIDKATHTDNILLIDKWGRYRDRFKWDDAYEAKRFVSAARALMAEQSPPLNQIVTTRNGMALTAGKNWLTSPWIRDFRLTQADGSDLFSRDLTGNVWIASFFFTSCPTICPRQNEYLAGLQKRITEQQVTLVSITTDPTTDTPAKLTEYAAALGANLDSWIFLTGNEKLIRRISAEFFRVSAGSDHHSSKLFVVDRWGRLRGSFDWQQPEEEVAMLNLIERLNLETVPKTITREGATK